MAFPIPDHLPKRATPVDVSSKILYKVDSATKESLNSSLASSWIGELNDSILETEQRIHDRIQSDLPQFQHQLETSKSIQTRYDILTRRVDELGNVLSNPENGLLPTLLSALQKHSVLAQETSDASNVYQSWSYLLKCKTAYTSVLSLVQLGKLPEAVEAGTEADSLVEGIPDFLNHTQAVIDLKKKLSATKARTQEQLSDAYSRSVVTSPTEITIHPSIQVRQSDTVLELSSVLRSLSPSLLADHLSTLRRDLLTYFVDHVLKQPYGVSVKSSLGNEVKLSLIPAPPNTEDLTVRLDNVSSILGFLSSNLFQHLSPQECSRFKRTLSKPITTSVLQNLLMPSLPSSFGLLPSYLSLLNRAVQFERHDIGPLSESDINDGSIKAWSDGASGHYERRRRVEILEHARQEILLPDDPKNTFEAFSEGGPETSLPTVVPVQPDEDFKDDAWGFDEPTTANPLDDAADGWRLDDDMDIDPKQENGINDDEEEDPNTPVDSKFVEEEPPKELAPGPEPDPADAWGWNEDEDLPADDVPEDNPWDDPWSDTPETDPIPEPPQPSTSAPVKAATRLEKLASKNKKHLNGNMQSPSFSPVAPEIPPTVSFTPPKPEPLSQPPIQTSRLNGTKRPADVITSIAPKELYKVPKRTKRILKMVETVIDESKLFYASNLFPPSKDSASTPGAILVQSASSIVELYQALYPVKFSKELEYPEQGMLLSNSCLYMTGSIQRIEDTIYGQPALKERLTECRQRLQVMGESWFDETIERQQLKIDQILRDGAQGFAYTGDQDRYDDCEAAVNEALKHIKQVGHRLKGILTKTKYYSAIGAVTDAALSRVLQDVLALSDIPEVESHRIGELCRILTALEGLFSSENPDEPSFVVAYVPNWLKFSYLSELLEASLADITYLFEQGALVDFEVDELVNLVRSLFADTSLRTNTINKIVSGQSVSSQ